MKRIMLSGILLAVCVAAPAATITVPGDWPDVQAAVIAANGNGDPSNTIVVAAGTWPATYQVHSTKNLTIIGAGAALTTIVPTADTGSSGDARGWFLADAGTSLTILNLTLDGLAGTYRVNIAVLSYANTLVRGCVIKNIHTLYVATHDYAGRGVQVRDNNGIINDCTFMNIGRISTYVFGENATVLITGNTFLCKGQGDWLDYAVEVEGDANVKVSHNKISNCLGVAVSDGSTSAGILATTFFDDVGPNVTTIAAEYNTFSCNSYGVVAGYPGGDATIASVHYNNFVGGQYDAVYADPLIPMVNAENNWYGAADGPGPVGSGSGDGVSLNVDFTPWQVASVSECGLQVDLNGTYMMPHKDFAEAATSVPLVAETSNAVSAVDATFTPFSNVVKPPRLLAASLLGRSYECDIDLSGNWFPLDSASIGATVGVGITGSYVSIKKSGGNFNFTLRSTDGSLSTATYSDTTGATRWRVEVDVDGSGASSASVIPLNGSAPWSMNSLGGIATTVTGSASFFVTMSGNGDASAKSTAKMKVSDFLTSAEDNVMSLFADDPYVKTTESIQYRFGMANLLQNVFGFQAFLDNPSFAVQGALDSRSYSSSPFPSHILPPGLDIDGNVGFGMPAFLLSGTLTHLNFNSPAVAVEGSAKLTIDVDSGSPSFAPTRFSDEFGGNVTPTREASNTVVVDSTLPVLSGLTATEGVTNVLNGVNPTIQGTVHICVNAEDLGVAPSGLACQPTISINFPSGPDVLNQPMYADTGNTFCYDATVTAASGCGTATITIDVSDDAGNAAAPAAGTLNLNTTQVAVTVELFTLTTSMTRGIQFVLGGTLLSGNSPVTINKDVVFTSGTGTVTLTALDVPIPCGAAFTRISAKDVKHTLRQNIALAGGPSFTASFTGSDSLLGGDANGDNLIDILDFGVFASQFGFVLGANTLVGYVGNHADFSGNGTVFTEDYTFIATQFLATGDLPPDFYGPQGTPKTTATIAELVKAGVPLLMARMMDANHDGIVTMQEISNFIANGGASRNAIGK